MLKGRQMVDQGSDEAPRRTITKQTWDWAREAYPYEVEKLFDESSTNDLSDGEIAEKFENLKKVGLDLELDFWEVARLFMEVAVHSPGS